MDAWPTLTENPNGIASYQPRVAALRRLAPPTWGIISPFLETVSPIRPLQSFPTNCSTRTIRFTQCDRRADGY